ncbi:MAG: type II/IV secretion system protein [Planctomycetes bacterium]|nr:type II/IV secretion system protein [Planctomycetota bacterium]
MSKVVSRKKALGQRLIDEGWITRDQLETALSEQRRTGEQLGRILHNLGFVTEDNLSASLQQELGANRVSLKGCSFQPDVLRMIPPDMARQHWLVPMDFEDGVLTVAMADPCNIVAVDAVRKAVGCAINVVAASPPEIRLVLDRHYADAASHDSLIERIIEEAKHGAAPHTDEEAAGQAPIIELVDNLIVKALKDHATDIHLEPEEKLVRTRYRIDGILHRGPSMPKELQSALTCRIKIQAHLDISERRTPQDGRMKFGHNGSDVDLRVSVLPTAHGEDVVLRVLDKSSLALRLSRLGFDEKTRKTLGALVQEPHGMLLVTGPTGSGKTTTLYSLLTEINSLEKNVITIEDPIEYQLPMIRQSQVNSKIGLTFAAGLRAILRQDPDVVMLGEVRDVETARIAISAALTGHFVLTTLHTNTAAGALPRLMDMGIEPFLLSSSVSGVLAQRLVRKICAECRETYEASPAEAEQLGCEQGKPLYRGTGCPNCRGTGYKGRTVLYELILPTERIRKLILERASDGQLAAAAVADGTKAIQLVGTQKVLDGETTMAEVARVCRTAL